MHKSETSPSSKRQSDRLKQLEYVAVAGSAVGSVVAAWYEQILFAATPLTLALALNLWNRQRLEEQIRLHTDSAIADIHNVIESLHDQIQSLPTSVPELDPITDVLTELQRVTQRLEKNALRQEDWEVMNVRFKLMQESLEDLRESFIAEQQAPPSSPDQTDLQAITESLQELASQPLGDLSTLQTQIQALQEQVHQLKQENQNVIKPYLKRLIQTIKKMPH